MLKRNKLIVLMMVLILAFSSVACTTDTANNNTSNTNTANETNQTNETSDSETTEGQETDNAAEEASQDTEEADEETETTEETDEPQSDLPKRADIPEQYRWDLTKVFADQAAFMADVEAVKSSLDMFQKNKDAFTSDYDTFKSTLMAYEKYRRMTDKIYVFATLQAHTDTENTDFSDLEDIAAQLSTDLSEATSYFLPAIANMDSATLKTYMANEDMQTFKPYIDDIIKDKKHILSLAEEELLAKAQILFETPESIYDAYKYNTDLSEFLPEPDFNKFWSGKREDKLTVLKDYYLKTKLGNDLIAEIYESEIKKNTFFAEARNFDSALASALHTDGMTKEAYNKVFEITYDNLDKLHKWISIKKRVLELEDGFHFYDQYSPLISQPYVAADYETGKEIIYTALAPLGQKYIDDLKVAFDSRVADVYTTQGKYEGGYQWGTYDTDPFVLLNFRGLMTDVSTVAHEMGHALNFQYSNAKQGYFTAGVPIFNAEIASTTNEAMVFEHRIKTAKTPLQKQQALLGYIELIENTIFTQMIYADFEKRAYEAYDAGTPINAELFNTIMGDVLKQYYGEDYILEDTATLMWSEIPHFYNAYYVYKYATGLSAGLTFADNVLNGSESDRDKYLDYLAAGSSEPPLTLLKKAGVDFSTGEPMQRAFDTFERLVDEFEKTLDQ